LELTAGIEIVLHTSMYFVVFVAQKCEMLLNFNQFQAQNKSLKPNPLKIRFSRCGIIIRSCDAQA
jgi:hypothetical protein